MNENTSESITDFIEGAKKGSTYWEEMAILNFTEALLDRIEALGMAKKDLAKKLNVSSAYMTKLIGGRNNFTLRTMVRVARAVDSELHVDIHPSNSCGEWRSYSSDTPLRLVILPLSVNQEWPDRFTPTELPPVHEAIPVAA